MWFRVFQTETEMDEKIENDNPKIIELFAFEFLTRRITIRIITCLPKGAT